MARREVGDNRNFDQYSDTGEGALAFLRDVSDLDLTGATAHPDGWVEGVWLVKHPRDTAFGECTVVYLKELDFETGDL